MRVLNIVPDQEWNRLSVPTRTNRFFFYEVYQDEQAFEAHRASAHYPRWRAAAAEVLAEPTNASRCTVVFPKEYK